MKSGTTRHIQYAAVRGALLAAALVIGSASSAWSAADETLRILVPRAAGTTPVSGKSTLPADHYSLYAYPGIEYRMRVAARGGAWPYTYSLSGAPSEMAVDSEGLITWPNPTATTGTITLTVTDANLMQAQSTWTVTVTAGKFVFLDCDVAGPGTGTLSDPYKNISDLAAVRPAHVGKIVYFRSCASPFYHVYDMALNASDRRDFHGSFDPMQWIAYPGERPVFDAGYRQGVTQGAFIRFQSGPAAFIGFECTNTRNKCVNLVDGLSYVAVTDNQFHEQAGTAGENPAFIMTDTGGGSSSFLMIMKNEFYNFGHRNGGNGGACIKMYAQSYLLVADNVCRNSVGPDNIQGFDLKGGLIDQAWIRNNVVHDVCCEGIGGSNFTLANSVFEFNRIYNCDPSAECFFLNNAGQITTEIKVRRNTILGRWRIHNVNGSSGPFVISNNVLVSSDAVGSCFAGHRLVCPFSGSPSRIQQASSPNNDLVCAPADNCTNSTGYLSANYQQYLGLKGHVTTPSSGAPALSPPRNLRVQ